MFRARGWRELEARQRRTGMQAGAKSQSQSQGRSVSGLFQGRTRALTRTGPSLTEDAGWTRKEERRALPTQGEEP